MEKRKSVLAIDDNVVQLNAFRNILSDKYEIFTVNSAANAINFMNANAVDCILLDIQMPYVSGFDFLYDIRKIPSYMITPIIIVSGVTGAEFFAEARKSSAFDVLSKPVEPEHLISTIDKAISDAENQRHSDDI
ncbi:MAG: response regulator [Treponema sp.]|nr:response regulator [Treponema sp.]